MFVAGLGGYFRGISGPFFPSVNQDGGHVLLIGERKNPNVVFIGESITPQVV